MLRLVLISMGICALLIQLCGCGGSSSSAEVSNPLGLPSGFLAGTPTTIVAPTASNSSVPDPVTGFTYQFPSGGDGTLTTAPLTQTPVTPVDGPTTFYVSYSGSHPVTVTLPQSSTTRTYLFLYGNAGGEWEKVLTNAPRWYALSPTSSDTNTVSFSLPFLAPATSRNRRRQRATTDSTLEIAAIQRTATPAMSAVETKARQFIANAINLLPPATQAAVQAHISAIRPLSIVIVPPSGSCSYEGFSWYPIVGTIPTPVLTLREDVTDDIIAHEVGHYLSHMLPGDAAGLRILQTCPDANHGIGDLHDGRMTIAEDYAYFMQYSLLGNVNQGDPKLVRQLLGAGVPSAKDYPSIEGYATVLMASLTNTKGTTIDFSGATCKVPVINIGIGDCINLYAAGASTIGNLQLAMETLVSSKGMDGALQVHAEATGWSYHGSGRVVSQQTNQGVSGAIVTPVVTVNGTDYTLPSTTTGTDGSYTLSRVFPGVCMLRVVDVSAGNTTSQTVNVDWSGVTTAAVDLGFIAVDHPAQTPKTGILACTRFLVGLSACLHFSDTTFPLHPADVYQGISMSEQTEYNSASGLYDIGPVTWVSNTFTASGTDTMSPHTFDVRGTVSADGKTLLSLTVTHTSSYDNWAYQVTNFPLTANSDGSYNGSVTSTASTFVKNLTYSYPPTIARTLIDVAWDGNPLDGSWPARLNVGFSK